MPFINYIRKIHKDYLKKRPENVKHLIKLYGDMYIREIEVCRTPLEVSNKLALHLATLGKLSEYVKNKYYDDIFHLNMNVHLSNGLIIGLEKNERIKIVMNGIKKKEFTMCKTVKNLHIKLSDFIDNGENLANSGKKKNFYRYTAYRDNCQKFVNDLLYGNRIFHLTEFVMQDIEDLVKNHVSNNIKGISKNIIDFFAYYKPINSTD